MTPDPQTQQRLLELVYDLLPEAEATELRRQIDAEPELARAYARAQDTAKLFASAARVHSPKIDFKRPEIAMSTSSDSSPSQVTPRTGRSVRRPWARSVNWAVGLTAVVLLIASVGGYLYHTGQLDDIAAEHMRLQVAGPANRQTGVETTYAVTTSSVFGKPMPARIKFAVYAPDEEPKWHNETTDAAGRLSVTIDADRVLPRNAVLKVVAEREDTGNTEQIETRLAVEPVHYVTRLTTDKPLYRPGETVYYRTLTLSRFHLASDGEVAIQFEILDPSGGVVPDSTLTGTTEEGVGNGAFTIPAELAGGEYTLLARSLDGAFPEQKRPFFVRRYRLPGLKKELEFTRDSYGPGDAVTADFLAERSEGGPAAEAQLQIIATVDGREVFRKDAQSDRAGAWQIEFTLPEEIERGDGQLAVVVDDGANRETIAKTIPINLGKVDVAFFPEGGDLVGGLENRVYFVARDTLGEPVQLEGTVVDGSGRDVASVETTHEGMGSFSFVPYVEEQYHLKITAPADVAEQSELPKVSAERKIVLSTGMGVFEAGEPLEFNIRTARAGIPLVVSASCRGAAVGQQMLITAVPPDQEIGANSVSIPLSDEVGGVIRLTVYDYSDSPPEPVAERLVYRRPARRLNVDVVEDGRRYAPGEEVDLSLQVTDQNGEPVSAVLGVAVVDDALLSLADDDHPGMATHLLLTTEVEKPEDLEDADFYLSDSPEAPEALDLLLGTQGWRRFVQKTLQQLEDEGRDEEQLARLVAVGGPGGPPVVFDNLDEIRSKYQTGLAEYQQDRTRALKTLSSLSFFGGLALVLLVAMMGLLRMISGIQLWVPAVGATVCCLIMGWILMDREPGEASTGRQVAFCTFNLTPVVEPNTAETEDDLSLWGEHGGLLARDIDEDAPEENARWEMREEGVIELAAQPDGADEIRGFALDGKELLGGDLEKQLKRLGDLNLEDAERLSWEDRERFRRNGQLQAMGRIVAGAPFKEDGWADDMAERDEDGDARRRSFVVREYAHQLRRLDSQPDVRSDFAETLYWHPKLITDKDGRANVAFQLCDSLHEFSVQADAHGSGLIGSGGGKIAARIPFSLEPKLPLEVTAGDRIDLPLAVVNDTDDALPVTIRLECGDLVALEGEPQRRQQLAAGQRGREYFGLNVTGQRGDCELTFHGTARGTGGELADRVSRPLKVVPPGFPRKLARSGQIEGPEQFVVELPEYLPGSLEVTLNVFPSTLADLQKGMESILREPNGCFEQASTSNYPNVLTMQYMREHNVADPGVTRRAKELLKKGYAKLVGYECPKEGYEWFGGDPGHEALTAYGLMEFRDMAEVYDVDQEMIERTAQWLLDRRDGKGGFQRNARALDSFGRAPDEITDAYIAWALSESGQDGIEAEIEHVIELAAASDDPYLIALAAAGSLNADREEEGDKLLQKLAEAQTEDGHLEGTQGSITRSGGHSLKVETTALAALAWLKRPAFAEQANRAVKWIMGSRQGCGGFGSTQATILALKALVEHSKAHRHPSAAGTLIVKRDDMTIGEHAFGAQRQETIVIDGLEADLQPGENKLTVNLTGDNQMPYALEVSFRTRRPASDENCPLRLRTKLAKTEVKAGETVGLTAELSNTSDEGQPMTIAILGLPAGLEARPDQLEELKTAGTIDYYETRAREVICYWRSLAPKKKVAIKLDLVAAVPGAYTGPASQTYLYYTAEQKQWTEPLGVEIAR